MKKLLIAAAISFVSTTAVADTPAYRGSMVGGIINNGGPNDAAVPIITFGCDDPNFGHFDACIDMYVIVQKVNTQRLLMDAKISEQFARKNPRILMRYAVNSKIQMGDTRQKYAVVTSAYDGTFIGGAIHPDRPLVFYRATIDGGKTWSPLEKR